MLRELPPRLLLIAGAMNLAGGAVAQVPDRADEAAGTAAARTEVAPAVPQQNFLSSLKQAFNQDFGRAVVTGHFDVGTAPDAHRYYCLLDSKTGKRQPNGVAGEPFARPDGMTGLKASAVSLYSCASAEQQGLLVTDGYVLNAAAAATKARTAPAAPAAPGAASFAIPPDQIDVAGVKLGMALDQVRAALKSKQLRDYYESTAMLSRADPNTGVAQPIQGGRFVNVVAAWSAPPATPGTATAPGTVSAPGTENAPRGEFYEVQFTPVPGNERAMAIAHSVGYPAESGLRESALESALVHKYGGFSGPRDLPKAPTWRIQSTGEVQVGDTCDRRGVAGLPRGLPFEDGAQPNPALSTAPEELRYQIDHCGVAMVTEDHVAVDLGAATEDRVITRVTITAYGPAIAALGAAAARQLIQGAVVKAPKVPRADSLMPAL